MTYLQQLAFDRIERLGQEAKNLIPKRRPYHMDGDEFERVLFDIQEKLSEQEDWITALNREEHS